MNRGTAPLNDETTENFRHLEPFSRPRPGALLELLEVRRLFEPMAATLAATRVTSADLAEVAARLEAMTAARDDVAAFHTHDIAFHRAVHSVTGNETLTSLLHAVSARTVRAVSPRRFSDRDSMDAVLTEHAAILAALAARDPTLAHAATLVHINSTETWLRRDLIESDAPQRPARRPGPSRAGSRRGSFTDW